MTARDAILARIRTATADVRSIPPTAQRAEWTARPGDPDLLAERIADYRATVTRTADVPGAIAALLAEHGATRIAVPRGLPADWLTAVPEPVPDEPPLDHRTLAAVDGVLTGCALAIAETGTFVLDAGPAQGRRALTLLPDLHICVVHAEQVLADVPDAIAALSGTTRPVTLVSGPSATSDIELDRVEGVHGPRRLEVLLV
jgi:L-lactate dehydrogenase complex protein LldG